MWMSEFVYLLAQLIFSSVKIYYGLFFFHFCSRSWEESKLKVMFKIQNITKGFKGNTSLRLAGKMLKDCSVTKTTTYEFLLAINSVGVQGIIRAELIYASCFTDPLEAATHPPPRKHSQLRTSGWHSTLARDSHCHTKNYKGSEIDALIRANSCTFTAV